MRLPAVDHRRPGVRRVGAALGALALLAAVGHGLSQVRVETGVEEFVPRDDRAAHATTEVAERFGGDPVVVLLEGREPMELLAKEQLPALLRLEGELAALPDVASVYGPATVLNQIAGQAQDLLAELAGYRDGIRGAAEERARRSGASPAEVAAAGRQATVGFDERYSGLLSQGMAGGLPTLHNQTFVDRVVLNDEGDPRPQWDFVVPRSDAVAILVRPTASLRQAQVERLVAAVEATVADSDVTASRTTVSGIPPVVAALGEQIRHEIPLLGGAALLGVGGWFLLTSWTRRRLRLLPLGATLLGTACTLALAGWLDRPLSLTAVAFLPVLLGIGTDFMTYLHRGVDVRTVVAVATASAAGFAALAVAPVPAVADLGLSLAVGLLITVGVSLGVHRWLPVRAEQAKPDQPPAARPSRTPRRARLGLVAAVGLVAVAGWAVMPLLSLKADFRSMASDLPVYEEAQQVERVMGASGEIVVAVEGDTVLDTESLAWMQDVRRQVAAQHGDQLEPVQSPPALLGFLGEEPTDDQLAAALRLLPPYLTASVVTPSGDMAVMSYGVHLDDIGELQRLRTDLDSLVAGAPDGLDVRLAGLPVVAVSAYEALDEDRFLTAALGVLAAGLVLFLLLPRRAVAGLAVLAAVIASGFVLLGMWAGGLGLTPITAAVGSLTAAVACELTVVLAYAIQAGDRRIVRAVELAAVASATGYGVLALSDLALIRGFGLVLAVTVLLALAASRLVVWAFLEEVAATEPSPDNASRAPARTLVEVGR